ncbi:MAG: hypothetical protein N3A69_13340 [Leptospiraceae bacterium]|nr:hypothetical protein [Leptospiraceae bacterium]
MPLTVLVDSLRGIFNEGMDFQAVIIPTIGLVLFGILCFLIGLKLYKWE